MLPGLGETRASGSWPLLAIPPASTEGHEMGLTEMDVFLLST